MRLVKRLFGRMVPAVLSVVLALGGVVPHAPTASAITLGQSGSAGAGIAGDSAAPTGGSRPASAPPLPLAPGEIEALRTPTTRAFRQPDRSLRVQAFAGPVNYRDPGDGKLRPIDPTLFEIAEATRTVAVNRANRFRLTLPKQLAGDWVSVETSDAAVSLRPAFRPGLGESAIGTGSVPAQSVSATDRAYPKAFAGATLSYESVASGVKESITLSRPTSSTVYSFDLRSSGVTPRLAPDGSIGLFVSGESTPSLCLPRPCMWDAKAGAGSEGYSDAVRYVLSGTGPVWRLDLVVDSSWLSDPARSYPVTIDPGIVGVNSGAEDTYISSGYGDSNYCSSTYLWVTNHSANCNYSDLALLKLGQDMVGDIAETRVDGYQVLQATASLRSRTVPYPGLVHASEKTSYYITSQVRWNTDDRRVTNDSPKLRVGTATTWYDFDVTAAAQDWLPKMNVTTSFAGLAFYADSGTHVSFSANELNSGTPVVTILYGGTPEARLETPASGTPTLTITTPVTWEYAEDLTGDPQSSYLLEVATSSAGPVAASSGWVGGASESATLPVPAGGWIDGARYFARITVKSATGSATTPSLVSAPGPWTPFRARLPIPSPTLDVSATTTASRGWFKENAANRGIDDSATAGRGAVRLAWKPDPEATSYAVYLFDGNTYRGIGTTTGASFDTSGRGVWPTDSAIASMPVGLLVSPFASGTVDLRDDPRPLYAKTPGNAFDGMPAYAFKVQPCGPFGAPSLSIVPTVGVELDSRTVPTNADPRHAEVGLGCLFADDAWVRLDKGDLVLSALDLSIPGVGPQVTLGRSYRSSSVDSATLAPGWRFTFERSMRVGSATATYTDEVGDSHVFRLADGTWVAPHGCSDRLAVDNSGCATLSHKGLTKTAFDSTGRLASESDADGNRVTYEWAADGSSLAIRTPADNPLLLRRRRITVTFSDGRVTGASAQVDGEEPDRTIAYVTSPSSLTVTRFPGTDAEQTMVYRYDDSRRLSTVAVPGFTPSGAGEATWRVRYGSSGTSVALTNETGANTPLMPRTVSWDSSSGVGAVVSATGTSTIAIDLLGRMCSSTRENTAAATLDAYDVDNNLIRETSPLGRVTAATFDGRGNTLTETDQSGAVTSYVYDGLDRCVCVTDPRGSVTTRAYVGSSDHVLTEDRLLDSAGEKAHIECCYNSDGTKRWERKAIDASHTLETDYADYQDCGVPKTTTQCGVEIANGVFADIITRMECNQFGSVIRTTDALGNQTASTTVDAAQRPVTVADADGTLTHTEYGVLGGVARTWRSNPASPGVAVDWREGAFDGAGNLVTETVKASNGTTVSTVVHAYDAAGREIMSDASDVPGVAVTRYDGQGAVAQSWSEGANTSATAASERSAFDADGRETSSTAAGSVKASDLTSYTPTGETAETTAADGPTTDNAYDDAGDLEAESVSTDSGDAVTQYSEDTGGRTIAESDADGTTQSTVFDLDDNAVATQFGSTQPIATRRANVLGWALESRESDGVLTRNSYDLDGRIVRSEVGGQVAVTHFDASGRVLSIENPDGTRTDNEYDPFGRRTASVERRGSGTLKSSSTVYDGSGRAAAQCVSAQGWPGSRSLVTTVAPDGSVLESETCDNGDSTLASCADGAGRLRSWVATVDGTPLDFSVTATDLAGRTISTASNSLPLSRTATFTDAGQLRGTTLGASTASYTYSPVSGKKTGENARFVLGARIENNWYAYDECGRVTSATIAGVTTTYGYDADTGSLVGIRRGNNPTCTLTYETTCTANWTGHLASSGNRIYRSDGLGHRTSSGPTTNPTETAYVWSGERLTNLRQPSCVATYTYDGAGQRLSSVVTSASRVTTTAYDYEGTRLLGLRATRSDGSAWKIRYLYDAENAPFAFVYKSDTTSPTAFALETSDRGDVREILTSKGASIAFYGYDAYGVPDPVVTATAGSLTASQAAEIAARQVIRYAGYCYDADSSLYYCSARYYDPAVAAFISRDPAQDDGQQSAYQYCKGDCIGTRDPDGCAALYRKAVKASRYDWLREQIVYSALLVAGHLKGYHQPPDTHTQGAKSAPNGYSDCSGLVTWIMSKVGVFPKSAIKGWASGDCYHNAPKKGHPNNKYFDRMAKTPWRIGDIVESEPRPKNHVALIVRDSPDPYIIESSPTYNGAAVHKLSSRKKRWNFLNSGRYFWSR